MTMVRLEEYLDGMLSAQEAREVETAVAGDAVLAGRLERIKAQRALRAAALSTYTPSAEEAGAEAIHTMAVCYAQESGVAGRIGWSWAKKFGAVAAMVMIAAGSFVAGRATGHPQMVADIKPIQPAPQVATVSNDGPVDIDVTRGGEVVEQRTFSNAKDANAYVDKVVQQQNDDQPQMEDDMLAGNIL